LGTVLFVHLRKWIARTVLACAALVLISILLAKWLSAEPKYQGRTLSKWTHDLGQGSLQEKQKAAEAIRNLGAQGVPFLAQELTNPPTPMQKAAGFAANYVPEKLKGPLRRIYDPPNETTKKLSALIALQALGTNATGAIDAVTEILQGSHAGLTSAAAQALTEMGTNALPALISTLDYGSYMTRASACHALVAFHTNAAPAVPRLAQIAADEIGPIVSVAFYALSRIGPAAVSSLAQLLNNTNSTVRSQALYALGAIGPAAAENPETLPMVLEASDDDGAEIRWRATEALNAIGRDSDEVLQVFVRALKDENAMVRAAGATSMGLRPRLASAHLNELEELLMDPSPEVRRQAAFAIGQSGRWGVEKLERLKELSQRETNAMVVASMNHAIVTIRDSEKISRNAQVE
jgi:HEAT repeat protein